MRFDESHRYPISPPGSISVDHFSSRCTACHLCISSCPTQVLFPSFLDYGIAGIFQPKMNYTASYCNFDCVICGQVCPTGAILPLDINIKKQVQIGKAYFAKDDCIVVTKKRDCGACSEHCPTKAVKMVPYEQRLVVPEVDDKICIGCGAC
jgi:ferredoxin